MFIMASLNKKTIQKNVKYFKKTDLIYSDKLTVELVNKIKKT